MLALKSLSAANAESKRSALDRCARWRMSDNRNNHQGISNVSAILYISAFINAFLWCFLLPVWVADTVKIMMHHCGATMKNLYEGKEPPDPAVLVRQGTVWIQAMRDIVSVAQSGKRPPPRGTPYDPPRNLLWNTLYAGVFWSIVIMSLTGQIPSAIQMTKAALESVLAATKAEIQRVEPPQEKKGAYVAPPEEKKGVESSPERKGTAAARSDTLKRPPRDYQAPLDQSMIFKF